MKISLSRLITLFSTMTLSLCSSLALAQSQQTYSGWTLSTNVDQININHEVANRPDVMVADSATAIGLAGEYFRSDSNMIYAIGLNYIMYNDNNEFSQYVEDNWYNGRNYEESDANAFMIFAEAGPKIYFGADNLSFFSARAGISAILDSTRSISYCSDCYSEDININGGLYGALGIGHSFDRFDLSLQFQQYFTGDIDNSLRLQVGFTF